MITVAPGELEMVRFARHLLFRQPFRPWVGDAPKGMTRGGLDVLSETLSKGCVSEIMRLGGWRRSAWAAGLEPLKFGRTSFELCRMGSSTNHSFTLSPVLHSGDHVLCYLMAQANLFVAINSPLVALSYTDVSIAPPPAAEWAVLSEEPLATIVEALTPALADRLVALEQTKLKVLGPARRTTFCQNQLLALECFIAVAREANRPSLVTFIVYAAQRIIAGRSAGEIVQEHNQDLRLEGLAMSEQQETLRASGGLYRAVVSLGQWYVQLRGVRSFDAGYSAAQSVVKQWECLGGGFHRAAEVLAALEGLVAPPAQKEDKDADSTPV